jgi:hypothetical protein
MTSNLWTTNHPRDFWQCSPNPPDEDWNAAIISALPHLGLAMDEPSVDQALSLTLGEGRFGANHWELGMAKRIYYLVKPFIPRQITRRLRRYYSGAEKQENWPIDDRYVIFLWETLRQVMLKSESTELALKSLWPNHHHYSFVLTHDIETAAGQEVVEQVADLEENFGYRSSFNFVPEKYRVDDQLMVRLCQRGFEVGVHGLKHDGRLFSSKSEFPNKARRINRCLKQWNSSGFRAELTHRHPEWMQALDVEYDLSFFDTDPFEPIPGGTMSIWPFFMGHFVELPYTLVQDCTLISILHETSPNIWLEKVDFIESHHGMALLNSHPDYLRNKVNWNVYKEFLVAMKQRGDYWHALPVEVARWWKHRAGQIEIGSDFKVSKWKVALEGENMSIEPKLIAS